MTALKHHFLVSETTTACGRGKVVTTNVYNTTCLACRGTETYHAKWREAEAAKEAAFMAQTPKQHHAQFGGLVVCGECASDLFRYRGRSCYGHYENYVCADCGHVEQRLTETGMSF